jgi:2-aminoadipate transaminase
MTEGTEKVERLLRAPVRSAIDGSAYGAWRRIVDADAVGLSFGFPFPDALPQSTLTESVAAVFEAEGPEALQYGGGRYAGRLTEIVRERAAARGIDAGPDEVALTNGATHAIDTVCRAFLDPGDALVAEEPTFMGALSVFRNHGVEIVPAPVNDAGLDVDALADILAARRERGAPDPSLVYTIPNFQNPTGTTLPERRRRRLLDVAAEYDAAVLEDDAYGDLRYDGDPEPPLLALDDDGRVLRVGTFSKIVAPGVRLGWVLGDATAVRAVDTLAAGGTNTFTRSVVGHYCDAGGLERALPDLRAAYRERRDRCLSALETHMPGGTAWTTPDGGFFVWVDLAADIDTTEMLDDAIDNGVTYLPGAMFYPEGGGEHSLRLSFSWEDPDAIERGVAALAETVRTRQ